MIMSCSDQYEFEIPERMGWMPLRNKEIARRGVNPETAPMTSESVVNSFPSPVRNIRTMVQKMTLMRMLVAFTTMTENLVTAGCPAPSSLLTRTLQLFKPEYTITSTPKHRPVTI